MPDTPTPTSGSTPTGGDKPVTPEYVTVDVFNRQSAFLRGLTEKVEGLVKTAVTPDFFVTLGLAEKNPDGTFKAKTAAPASATKKEDQPEPWRAEIDRLNADIKSRDEALAGERRKAAETEKKSAVIEALNKAGAVNASRDYLHVAGAIQNKDGKYFAAAKDEYGADKEIPLEDYVKEFLTKNPELKKASGYPGSGTPASDGSTASGPGHFTVEGFLKRKNEFKR